jgi:hypothetical protein
LEQNITKENLVYVKKKGMEEMTEADSLIEQQRREMEVTVQILALDRQDRRSNNTTPHYTTPHTFMEDP